MTTKAAIGFFVLVVVVIVGTWMVLAGTGCTPAGTKFAGQWCNPWGFGSGGSCAGGSSGGKGKCNKKAGRDTSCETRMIACSGMDEHACTAETDCCDWKEGYRRFNRSRREGYRRFAGRR